MGVPESIQTLVKRSGNSFHSKVACAFRESGWHVTISPYYLDGSSNRAREIDLIAERIWHIGDKCSNIRKSIHIRLIVECKYVSLDTVIWFDRRRDSSTLSLLTSNTPLREKNVYTEKYHYCTNSDAGKLFASESKKQADNDPFYKAINQALHSMVSFRRVKPFLPASEFHKANTVTSIDYPVVICSSFDRLYRVDLTNQDNVERIEDPFLFEVDYAYLDPKGDRKNEYFLIDFVRLGRLRDFLDVIESDKDAIAGIISF